MAGPNGTDPLSIARRMLAQPSAPFHEGRVMTAVAEVLDALGIPFRRDRYGNLIARHGRGRGPVWALVAHTDHPGIEVTSVRGGTAHGTFLGGVRPESLPGARVLLYGEDGVGQPATVLDMRMVRGEKRVRLLADNGQAPAKGAFGTFDLPRPTVNRTRIAATAVDDLIGCATILSVLAAMRGEGGPGRVLGVFTRAEEVGFAGAQRVVEGNLLPWDAVVVSLEASMEMPGARRGMGPVIRVGDRASTFDGAVERHLHQTAQRLAKSEGGFRYQRQLMTGGTCEGSVFAACGYRTIGLAYPLLNYHNMTDDGGIAQEEVATGDYLGGVRLLAEAVRHGGRLTTIFSRYRSRLWRATGRYRRRL